jgi:hypothetical protein
MWMARIIFILLLLKSKLQEVTYLKVLPHALTL